MKRHRIIGTTEEAIARAEEELNRNFPPSFRAWLLQNNGLGIEGISIFPVLDDRDPRKTWDSIVRNYRVGWAGWLENFEGYEYDEGDTKPVFDHLLPFADFGTGDYYCFDYSGNCPDGECPIVHWSHETGETEFRAASFTEFVNKVSSGEYEYD
ncbi:MAG: SMI1/KNR4 family protein [Armatimonadetes bacterium]|nr:SMI1/KNR4 family protein [Armatimonadota bacterium]